MRITQAINKAGQMRTASIYATPANLAFLLFFSRASTSERLKRKARRLDNTLSLISSIGLRLPSLINLYRVERLIFPNAFKVSSLVNISFSGSIMAFSLSYNWMFRYIVHS